MFSRIEVLRVARYLRDHPKAQSTNTISDCVGLSWTNTRNILLLLKDFGVVLRIEKSRNRNFFVWNKNNGAELGAPLIKRRRYDKKSKKKKKVEFKKPKSKPKKVKFSNLLL